MDEASTYPRTTSLDFLNRCSATMAAFHRYWDGKRNGRLMPARADLDPLEMRAWLPGIVLVDVAPRDPKEDGGSFPYRLTYRLVGTRATGIRGREATGKTVEAAYFGTNLPDVLENYRLVIEQRTHVYDWNRSRSPTGLMRLAETLLLPLSSDGETVDKVFIYFEVAGI
ncbi:MAG TPA: PAS domain-containing protein [Dongiaceae bacterium]